jgi:multicomponent Na+:H+ antiporter subunit D
VVSPLLAGLYLVPALNLGGIPPFSGFIGKTALLQAGVADGSVLAWVLVGGSVVTSLLTLYVVARVWTKAFWRSRDDAPEGGLSDAGPIAHVEDAENSAVAQREIVGTMPLGMLVPTAGMVLVSLLLTVLAGPLLGVADRAATDLRDRAVYVGAVLDGPGSGGAR